MRKTKSAILEAVHETAKELHQAGVMDKTTMREFDSLCLPPITKLQPDEIKQVREAAKVSQAVFATILNTSVYTVQKWESGAKKPTGTALKLLHMVKDKGLTIAF
jgi:putative transcriptional regulator